MSEDREQKLVDICFHVGLLMHDYPNSFKTCDEIAEWVAEQLKMSGFNTKPCGMSWGVLTKEK